MNAHIHIYICIYTCLSPLKRMRRRAMGSKSAMTADQVARVVAVAVVVVENDKRNNIEEWATA